MMGLIKGEYYKLVRTVSFWVILGILFLFGTGVPLLEKMMAEQMRKVSDEDKQQINQIMESIPEGVSTGIQWDIGSLNEDFEGSAIQSLENSFQGNNIQLFIALFATLFLVVEFSTGSMKIIVSRGYAKTKILMAKLLAICSANLLFVVTFVVCNFVSSYVVWGLGEVPERFAGKLLTLVMLQIFGVTAYSALALTVALMIRSTALSLVANVAIVAMGSNVFFLLDLIGNRRFHITRYWVINAMSESGSLSLTNAAVVRILITMLLTFILAYVAGMVVFRKVDVK